MYHRQTEGKETIQTTGFELVELLMFVKATTECLAIGLTSIIK